MKTSTESLQSGQGTLQLWTGILAGPFAWVFDHSLSYVLVPHSCSTGSFWILHLISLVSLFIAGGGVWISLQSFMALPPKGSLSLSDAAARARFMAVLGVVLSAYFVLVVIAMAVPRFILSPCDGV